MNVEEVKKSFGRCCLAPNFFDRFYEIFLKSNPIIPPMFAKTDFDKQKKLLRAGVNMVLMFAEGSQMAKMTMERIRKSHGKDAMNIDANLYPFWVESLLKAVKECDTNMNAQLESEWRAVLNPAIQHIAAGYQRSAS